MLSTTTAIINYSQHEKIYIPGMYNFPFLASTAWSIYEVSGTIFKSRFYSFICIFITSLQAFILFTKIVVSLVNTHSLYEILVSSTCTCSTYLQYIYLPQLGKFSGSLQVPLYCKHSSTVSFLSNKSKKSWAVNQDCLVVE